MGWLQQAVAKLEQNAFAYAGRPKKNARFAGRDGKGDVGEHGGAIKAEKNVRELENGPALVFGRRVAKLMRRWSAHIHR
jgi:hypothetical protein